MHFAASAIAEHEDLEVSLFPPADQGGWGTGDATIAH